eukprot:3118244-Pyramimonas_sp.AAC.1
MERLWIPPKTSETNPYGQGAPGESTSPSEFARITVTPPLCVQEAPAKLTVREPTGPIQSTILRCTLSCARAL